MPVIKDKPGNVGAHIVVKCARKCNLNLYWCKLFYSRIDTCSLKGLWDVFYQLRFQLINK